MGRSMSEYVDEVKSYHNLLVVDGLNLAFRYKARTNFPNIYNFAAKYISTVQSLAVSYKASHIIVLADGGSKNRRHIYHDYKGDRRRKTEALSDEEKQDFSNFIEEFNNTLEKLSTIGLVLKYKGVEADDIVANIVCEFPNEFEHTWMISSDRDWDLLITDSISRFSTVTRKEITLETWHDFYPYEPEDHISIKVLMGDKGDTVPGADGIGEKRAYTLVKTYGTAFDVLDALPLPGTQAYIKNLNNFGEQILTNYELMDLPSYYKDNLLTFNDEINAKLKVFFEG